MLKRYMALIRAKKEIARVADVALPGSKRRVRQKKWTPLENVFIPHRRAADGSKTLDATLDNTAYQLFRDGLLPQPMRGSWSIDRKRRAENERLQMLEMRAVDLQRKALQQLEQRVTTDLRKDGFPVRRSIREGSLVIGCDEAGRGPLAGPVCGAAVCRVPLSVWGRGPEITPTMTEPFGVGDSKSVNEAQRLANFKRITGASNFFELVRVSRARIHCSSDASNYAKSTVRSRYSDQELEELAIEVQPSLVSFSGVHVDSMFQYVWSIAMANHSHIDAHNIFQSSMDCMHVAARGVYDELGRQDVVQPNHTRTPIIRQLHHVFASLSQSEDMIVDTATELDSACDLFGDVMKQAPLVLVDGSHVPEATYDYFCDVSISGAAHHIVKGDARSWSIAAASNLAKVGRDDIMDFLDKKFPQYGFNDHKGYPVASHMQLIKEIGLSPVHRRSYNPCAVSLGLAKPKKQKKKKSVKECDNDDAVPVKPKRGKKEAKQSE